MADAHSIARELIEGEPPHPLLPLPSVETVADCLADPTRASMLAGLLAQRRDTLAKAAADLVHHELEPDFWRDARQGLIERLRVIILLGGNRSGKSRWCGREVMRALVDHPGTVILCVSEDEVASRETQQAILWYYLPPEQQALNGTRDPAKVYYINHSEAMGFSERMLVLKPPEGYSGRPSKVIFATYNQEPGQYEGMEFGHPTAWTVAWWADENLRLNWLNMLRRRGRFRPGTGLWSFTPIRGITPSIKAAVGKGAKTLVHRPSSLLPDRINVPGLPPGTMPYVQQPALPDARVWYFHSELSPFGPGPNGSGKPYADSVAEDCAGKPSEYIKRIAYGFTEDVIGLCYPKFSGDVHVIPPSQLPEVGTNYVFIDPAGDRNWFLFWVRVAPGNPSRFYIYREWPDFTRYGEWAVPTSKPVTPESHKGWDGDAGPAQRSQGWGVERYKALMLEEETVRRPDDPDPHRARLWRESFAGGPGLAETRDPSSLSEAGPIREHIRMRKLDPRAAKNPLASEKGGTNILTLFAQENRNALGELTGPRMLIVPAYSGKGIDDGIQHVQELLDYKETEPLCPVLNEPRLYVCSTCVNVIWMFENYTNRGGEDGGCKDPADLVRYLAQDADLRHVEPGRLRVRSSGFAVRT